MSLSGRSRTLGCWRSWTNTGPNCRDGNQPVLDPALKPTRPTTAPADRVMASFVGPTR